MDLGPYLSRIGLPPSTPLPPTLETLRTLALHHVTHVPFENVDVQLGVPLRLDRESLERKLVTARRGGYCFEQNGWFAAVLSSLGYDVTTLAARVRWNATGPTPRTHMLLVVRVDGAPWLVDVGFGGFVPTEPVPLVHDVPHETPLGTFRLHREGAFHVLAANGSNGWADMYAFTDEPHTAIDYEAMSHFTSTHPSSRFRKNLIVVRPTRTERRALLNDEYIVRGPTGEGTRTKVPVAEVPRLLREVFGLDVPDGTRFPALDTLPSPA